MEHFVIARAFFNPAATDIEVEKIDPQDWETYIDSHPDEFTWMEDTSPGKNRRLHIDSIPQLLKNRVRNTYGKKLAFAEPDENESFNIECFYQKKTGTIEITVRSILKKESIILLNNLASTLKSNMFSVINGVIVDDDPLNTSEIR